MLPSLLWFLLYSIPPLAGWWLCFRAPLGRPALRRSMTVPAPVDTVWRALDPRQGGFTFLYEIGGAQTISNEPLTLRLERRPRHSHEPFAPMEEVCELDLADRSISRREIRGGAQTETRLESRGATT